MLPETLQEAEDLPFLPPLLGASTYVITAP